MVGTIAICTVRIWTSLDFEVEKRLGFEWSGFQMGSEIRKPKHLESGQMAAILSKNIEIWTETYRF